MQEEPNQQEAGRALAEAEATCHRLAGIDFPWDITRALELALLTTFCVRSISGLLSRTGEFETRPRKRYDDTGLMVAELLRHGVNSEAGAAVIARLNRIHGHYAIRNDDFLYVLSTFVAEPIRWLARHGWRELSPQEQEHLFLFWQAVGERMGIEAIPGTLPDLLTLNSAVVRGTYAYAPSNQRIAEATMSMLLADWPVPLRPLARQALMGLLEAEVAGSLGWPVAPGWLQSLVLRALRFRSQLSAGGVNPDTASTPSAPTPVMGKASGWSNWAGRRCWSGSTSRSRKDAPVQECFSQGTDQFSPPTSRPA